LHSFSFSFSFSSPSLLDLHVEYLSLLPWSRIYEPTRLASSRQVTAANSSPPFRSYTSIRPSDDKQSYRAVARLWFLSLLYCFSCRSYRSRRSLYASPLPQAYSLPLRHPPLASRASVPSPHRPKFLARSGISDRGLTFSFSLFLRTHRWATPAQLLSFHSPSTDDVRCFTCVPRNKENAE